MTKEDLPLGTIQVSPRAIATIAYQAALQSYGVVGLAHKNFFNGVSHAIVKDPQHGIDVTYDGIEIHIDIYIIVEYGTRIAQVAESVKDIVRYQVEKSLGLPVSTVNVHVRGLRISEED
ncbi:MAG: Asp23/Gls24 family envelope stress response protein [Anaerolineales bacterium]